MLFIIRLWKAEFLTKRKTRNRKFMICPDCCINPCVCGELSKISDKDIKVEKVEKEEKYENPYMEESSQGGSYLGSGY